MKLGFLASTLAVLSPASAFHRQVFKRSIPAGKVPKIPSYNASVPIDHFNASDTRVFNNRYWVNDTYYKPGGPVIFFDFGEAGVSISSAAVALGEWNNTVSATIQLAKRLHGVAVGWEHRYYGYSHPFPLDTKGDDEDGPYDFLDSGLPKGGAADYKYLTAEQALEDVVYFAKNLFNKTQLAGSNAVLSGPNATQLLDPYHTPWIWVGGSYPGVRGAWLRLRNPEVFYAVWASSAPVHVQEDAWAYYNSISRALPKNCTSDIRAVARHVDDILTSKNQSAIMDLKTGVALASDLSYDGRSDRSVASIDEETIAESMFSIVTDYTQSFGVSKTVQVFCDVMEAFDVSTYKANASLASANSTTRNAVWYYNQGNGKPSDGGIVATNGDRGLEIGLAAYFFALVHYNGYILDLVSDASQSSTGHISSDEDEHSWQWQVLSEMGFVVNVNANSPLSLGSKFLNYTGNLAELKTLFRSIPEQDIPSKPNTTFPRSFGGWDMKPSNVMWTNGEFDPWRAFGVMSLEHDTLGAPSRAITQDVPECGKSPGDNAVFGLLYGGAVHAEDLVINPNWPNGYVDSKNPPLNQGVDLFLKAYDKWAPCFNASRTQPGSGSQNVAPGLRRYGNTGIWLASALILLVQLWL